MANSLTRLRTAREGLTVGKTSRIHCRRVRMHSFDTVALSPKVSDQGRQERTGQKRT